MMDPFGKNLLESIQTALKKVREITDFIPEVGIVLGTGLSDLVEEISPVAIIDYSDIPFFPVPTVKSHRGKLIMGYLGEHKVVAMAGRFHYYEGLEMKALTFPIRLLKYLGIEELIISNAAGGTNPGFYAGDIVIVDDHINLQGYNPLIGPNDDRVGPRFPDMLKTYNKKLNREMLAFAQEMGIRAHLGVYAAVTGPNLETPAEYKYLNIIGADLVGMSTVPEVLTARHMGLQPFVLSVVTNQCMPLETIMEVTVDDVIEVAKQATPKLQLIVKETLRRF